MTSKTTLKDIYSYPKFIKYNKPIPCEKRVCKNDNNCKFSHETGIDFNKITVNN